MPAAVLIFAKSIVLDITIHSIYCEETSMRKLSNHLENRKLGNIRIPRGHTSPLPAKLHHSPFFQCHSGGDHASHEKT